MTQNKQTKKLTIRLPPNQRPAVTVTKRTVEEFRTQNKSTPPNVVLHAQLRQDSDRTTTRAYSTRRVGRKNVIWYVARSQRENIRNENVYDT